MTDKKELILISGMLDISSSYCSFYEFATNYIFNIKEKGVNNTDIFFETVSKLMNNIKIRSNLLALGITGNGEHEPEKWCKQIINNKELKKLSLNELHFVMGYCARRCKVMKD